MVKKAICIIASLISMAGLQGCSSFATAGKDTLPSGGEMTMSQIYRSKTGLASDEASARVELRKLSAMPAQNIQANMVTNDESPLSNQFRQLPNPQIAMYVYPHLAHEGDSYQPVPGYYTAFFLYNKNHFAMNSELY